jgi:hypothetical protein
VNLNLTGKTQKTQPAKTTTPGSASPNHHAQAIESTTKKPREKREHREKKGKKKKREKKSDEMRGKEKNRGYILGGPTKKKCFF